MLTPNATAAGLVVIVITFAGCAGVPTGEDSDGPILYREPASGDVDFPTPEGLRADQQIVRGVVWSAPEGSPEPPVPLWYEGRLAQFPEVSEHLASLHPPPPDPVRPVAPGFVLDLPLEVQEGVLALTPEAAWPPGDPPLAIIDVPFAPPYAPPPEPRWTPTGPVYVQDVAAFCYAREPTQEAIDHIRASVARFHGNFRMQGTVAAAGDQCGVFWEEGLGRLGPRPWAPGYDAEPLSNAMEPVTPESLIRSASTVKPLTSAVIHQMVDEGLISMDDYVFCPSAADNEPFPDFEWIPRCLLSYDAASGPGAEVPGFVTPDKMLIQVHHLVTHEAGWARGGGHNDVGGGPFVQWKAIEATGGDIPLTRGRLIEYALSQFLEYSPGNFTNLAPGVSRYCNICFVILGDVIEKYGSKSFVEYVRQDILGPYGVPREEIQVGRSTKDLFPAKETYYNCYHVAKTQYPAKTPAEECWIYGATNQDLFHETGSMLMTARAWATFMQHYWVGNVYDIEKGTLRDPYDAYPGGRSNGHGGSLTQQVSSLILQCTNGVNFAVFGAMTNAQPIGMNLAGESCQGADRYLAERDGPWLTALFQPASIGPPVFHSGDTPAELSARAETMRASNMVPIDIESYWSDGATRFASVWATEDAVGGMTDWLLTLDRTAAGLHGVASDMDGRFMPSKITANVVPDGEHYSVLWYSADVPEPYEFSMSITTHDFAQEIASFGNQGSGLVDHDVLEDANGEWRVAAIWQEDAPVVYQECCGQEGDAHAWVEKSTTGQVTSLEAFRAGHGHHYSALHRQGEPAPREVALMVPHTAWSAAIRQQHDLGLELVGVSVAPVRDAGTR